MSDTALDNFVYDLRNIIEKWLMDAEIALELTRKHKNYKPSFEDGNFEGAITAFNKVLSFIENSIQEES